MPNALRTASRTRQFTALVVTLFAVSAFLYQMYFAPRVQALSSTIVISQVYGGGGNTGATFTHDFVELFNRGNATVSLAGWSVQYASATGTGNFGANTGQITPLSGSLAPGQYLLVQEASQAAVGSPLPTPDVTDATPIAMAAGAGKVALVNTTTPLGCNGGSTPCSAAALATIVDLVGYGTGASGANFFEGAGPAPTISAILADRRNSNGCAETDNNSADFSAVTPTPRNTSSPLNICGGDAPPSVSSTVPGSGATNVARATDVTITFSEPVNATAASFTISCANSGAHTFSLSGGPTTFTLNPDVDFAANEMCTVTVLAAQVTDQDAIDPPDNMTVNFLTGFTTIDAQVCGDPATFIHAVQGSGTTSPIPGTTVSIEGIVTADYQGAGQFGGYFVQEEDADADADPATSEGIFVFNTAFPVNVGDKVRVRGTVTEFLSSGQTLTELASVSSVSVCSSGNTVSSTTVNLPIATLSDWERYEGMLINIPQDLTVTETFTLARFGEVSLSVGGRLRNPTNIVAPGAPAILQQDINDRSRILLDDGNNQQNIDPTIYPTGGLSASNTLRSGYTVNGLAGILEQRFGVYRVQPVGPVTFNPTNPRSATPDPVGGNLKVAALNVLNFFTTLDTGSPICGPTGGLDCRGANTAFEFTRQRDKIINAILAINPDIAGLMEVQNDATATIQNLVDGLNDVAGAGTYTYINTGTIGTDAIKVALIYKPANVTPVGAYAILDSSVDPSFIDTKNRPSLAQTFARTATGAKLTVVVNHLKSKGSACVDVGDPDTGDGQGNCNQTRTQAATALVNWLATDPTGSGDPDFLIVGDMNSYAKEDPITTITSAGYTNLLESLIGADAYSYVFDGQSGYLDHALASSSLVAQTNGVTEWHNNADEPIGLDYNVEFKTANQINTFYTSAPFRASDHDPVLVGLNLNAPPTVDAGGPYSVGEGGSVMVTAAGNDPDGGSLTYAWDLDNNGSFETPGQNATFSAATLSAPSTHTIKVQVTDVGGLTAVDTATVNVIYNFTGFFQPVDNLPTINAATAGSAIPVKFSLSGNKGLNILAAGYPVSQQIACTDGAPIDTIEETVTAGGSSLSYDATTGHYIYVWKTNKAWAGTCRILVVRLNDGTEHTAVFRFK
jgi:predicted extracellular nuclease